MISHHTLPPPVDGGITSIWAALGLGPVTKGVASETMSVKMRSGRMSVCDPADTPMLAPIWVLKAEGIPRVPLPAGVAAVISSERLRICSPGRNPGWLIAGGWATKFAVRVTGALMIGSNV